MPIRTKAPNVQNKAVYPLSPSTLEDVDYALYEFINDELNIYSETNRGFQKSPGNVLGPRACLSN